MCGIVAAYSSKNIVPVLIDGLKRLEYRGYDSAGFAMVDENNKLQRFVKTGRVKGLEDSVADKNLFANVGIAHTRWATHGGVTEENAHPHLSYGDVGIVHNGIIENHEQLRQELKDKGYTFLSQTDTEVVVHLINEQMRQGSDLLVSVQKVVKRLRGAYALAVISDKEPGRIVGTRLASPLLVGVNKEQNEAYLGSDMSALIAVTKNFMVLDNGDVVDINQGEITVYNEHDEVVEKEVQVSLLDASSVELGEYRHFMQKEIFEQSRAIADTLEGRLTADTVIEDSFGVKASAIFDSIEQIQILACGTSYHAGLVAKNWIESFGMPCQVEVASEFKSRKHVKPKNALVVTLSQSGETIDTISALEYAKSIGFEHSLSICNVSESSLVRMCDLVFMTHAGPEIGVASTKAFTTQLVALLLLSVVIGRRRLLTSEEESVIVQELRTLPAKVDEVNLLEDEIKALSAQFADKHHALFLGRGLHFPIAMEGALKLKEISYIHAEAYPAGELKHGPLALVDDKMPVVAVAPNDSLLEKIKSNIQEVRARGGQLYVFADSQSGMTSEEGLTVINVAPVNQYISPIIYTIPLQMLSYHVALTKGTDVDKPRNLAKSVTVE